MDAAAGWTPLAAIAYTGVLSTVNHLWFAHLVMAARGKVLEDWEIFDARPTHKPRAH